MVTNFCDQTVIKVIDSFAYPQPDRGAECTHQNLHYSYRSDFTGLVEAAFQVWDPMVITPRTTMMESAPSSKIGSFGYNWIDISRVS